MATIFNKLKTANSEFNTLSANRFSLLTRKELYSIAKFLRNHSSYSGGLEKYNSQSTPILKGNCYRVSSSIL